MIFVSKYYGFFFRDKERSEKIVKSLNITVPSRDVRLISTDPKSYLRSICSQWLPLANAVLCILPNIFTISDSFSINILCCLGRLNKKHFEFKQA